MDWEDTLAGLERLGVLESDRVKQAMRAVDRKEFVDSDAAYRDTPLPIGSGQTISAPHMVAIMTELCQPREKDRVLEVGTGSGFQAAVLSQLVDRVVTIERVQELYESATKKLDRYDTIRVVYGDGSEGYPQEAPYDTILVTAASSEVPEALVAQLKEGGRLIIPVGDGREQELLVYTKKDSDLVLEKDYGAVRFVPLKESVED